MNKHFCTIESAIGRQPIVATMVGFHICTIERLIATVFYKKYEKFNNLLFSLLLSSIPWIYVIANSFGTISRNLSEENEILDYCTSLNSIGISFYTVISTTVIGTIAAIFISIGLYFVNRNFKKFKPKLRSNNNYLSEEFQRRENVRTTKTITCLIIVFLITYVVNYYIAYRISWAQNDKLFKNMTEFVLAKVRK